MMHLVSPPKFCITCCFQLLPGITVVPREIEHKSYAKFWDKQGALWSLWKWWILTFQLQQLGPTNKAGLPVVLSWFAATCLHVLSQFQALGRTKTCYGYDDHNLAASNIKKQFHDTEDVLKKAKSFLNLG